MKRQPKPKTAPDVSGVAESFKSSLEAIFSGEPATLYKVQMERGTFSACKRSFAGKEFEQIEMDTPKAMAIASMLIESDIFGAIDLSGDSLNIDAGAIVSHLVKKNLMFAFLKMILTSEGLPTKDADFHGRFAEFIPFCIGVIKDFFTLNQESLPIIGTLLMSGLGISAVGGQMLATLLAGLKRSGLSAKADLKVTS